MIQRLEWDSELFGFGVGSVAPGDLDPSALAAAARAAGVRCVTLRIPSDDGPGLRAAAACGFAVADVRVTLQADLKAAVAEREAAPHPVPTGFTIGPAARSDRDDLRAVAREISGWSRFAFDPGFGAAAAARLYDRWIDALFEGRCQVTLVARHDGHAVGLVACRLGGPRTQELDLVGVREGFHGRGVGASLVEAAFEWARERGARGVRVATQGRNPAAIGFYIRCGFRIRAIDLILHAWP